MNDAGLRAWVDQMLAATDLSVLASSLGLRRRGRRFICPACPPEKSATLSVERPPFWRCHRCGKSGDAITLIRFVRGCSFGEAANLLAKEVAIERPAHTRVSRTRRRRSPTIVHAWAPHAAMPRPEVWSQRAAAFLAWTEERLWQTPHVLAYLAGRGLDEATIRKARLGFNPTHLHRSRQVWGLELSKTVAQPDPSQTGEQQERADILHLPDGIVVPLFDPDGRVLRLRVRSMRPNADPRYLLVSGSDGKTQLAIPARVPTNAFLVTETELDGWLLAQVAGDLINVIALGTVGTRPDPSAHAQLGAADTILVSLDYEHTVDGKPGPGIVHAKWWLQQYRHAIAWPVYIGKDPGDYHTAGYDLRAWVVDGLRVGSGLSCSRMAVHRISPVEEKEDAPPGPTYATESAVEPAAPLPATNTALATSPVPSPPPPPPAAPAPVLIPEPAHDTDITWPPAPGACWMCGGTEFHLGYGGKRICCRCHPPVSITAATMLPAATHEGNARVGARIAAEGDDHDRPWT